MINLKFFQSVTANLVSLAIISTSGLVSNVVIMLELPVQELGRFNIVLSYYFVISQLTTLGIHSSAAYYAMTKPMEEGVTALAPAAAVSIWSVSVSVAFYLAYSLIGAPLGIGGYIAICALPFFSVNKVLLGYLNGRYFMFSHAAFTALRAVLMLIALFAFFRARIQAAWLFGTVACAEAALSALLFAFCGYRRLLTLPSTWSSIWKHYSFGGNLTISGLLAELKPRIGLMIGAIVLSESQVGVYSFAVTFIDGVYQLLIVTRKSLNPLIAEALANDDERAISALSRDIRRLCHKWFLPAFVSLNSGYCALLWLLGKHDYRESVFIFLASTAGMALAGYYILSFNAYHISGNPRRESMYSMASLGIEAMLFIGFTFSLGMAGIIIASFLSHIAFVLLTKHSLDGLMEGSARIELRH